MGGEKVHVAADDRVQGPAQRRLVHRSPAVHEIAHTVDHRPQRRLADGELPFHDRVVQTLLVAEEVRREGGRNPGVAGDAAHRGTVVPVPCEPRLGGVEDALAAGVRVAAAGASEGTLGLTTGSLLHTS